MEEQKKYIEFTVNDEHTYEAPLTDVLHSDIHAFGKGYVCILTAADLLKYAGHDFDFHFLNGSTDDKDVVTHVDLPENINELMDYTVEAVNFSLNTDLKGVFNAPYGINDLSLGDNSLERIDLNGPIGKLDCADNELTELNGSEHIRDTIICHNNRLRKLHISEGVTWVYAYNNNIEELELPLSIQKLSCDGHVRITNYEEVLLMNPDMKSNLSLNA